MPAVQIPSSQAPEKVVKQIVISEDASKMAMLFTDQTFCSFFVMEGQMKEDVGTFDPIGFGRQVVVNAGMWTEDQMHAEEVKRATQRAADIEMRERRMLLSLKRKYEEGD